MDLPRDQTGSCVGRGAAHGEVRARRLVGDRVDGRDWRGVVNAEIIVCDRRVVHDWRSASFAHAGKNKVIELLSLESTIAFNLRCVHSAFRPYVTRVSAGNGPVVVATGIDDLLLGR